jgi:hypothetical protein
VCGRRPSTALVFEALNNPIPSPVSSSAKTMSAIGVDSDCRDNKNTPAETISMPNVVGARVPMRSDSLPLMEAVMAMTTGWLVSSRPAWAGLSP